MAESASGEMQRAGSIGSGWSRSVHQRMSDRFGFDQRDFVSEVASVQCGFDPQRACADDGDGSRRIQGRGIHPFGGCFG